jgi:hypothetical protein
MKQTEDMFGEAFTDALVYGVGIIRIVNTLGGMRMSHVPREEFIELGEHLKHIAENTKVFTDKPDKM